MCDSRFRVYELAHIVKMIGIFIEISTIVEMSMDARFDAFCIRDFPILNLANHLTTANVKNMHVYKLIERFCVVLSTFCQSNEVTKISRGNSSWIWTNALIYQSAFYASEAKKPWWLWIYDVAWICFYSIITHTYTLAIDWAHCIDWDQYFIRFRILAAHIFHTQLSSIAEDQTHHHTTRTKLPWKTTKKNARNIWSKIVRCMHGPHPIWME